MLIAELQLFLILEYFCAEKLKLTLEERVHSTLQLYCACFMFLITAGIKSGFMGDDCLEHVLVVWEFM